MDDRPVSQADHDNELEILIRARYPIVYVVSWEEERVLRQLDEIGRILNKKVYDWTINRGISRHRGAVEGAVEGKKGTKDPILALKEIQANSDPSIYVMRDFHAFLKDSGVLRGLRDLAISLRQTYTSVVLLCPVLQLPDELEKDVTVVDFPLPNKAELERLLEEITRDLKGNQNFKLELGPETKSKLLDAAMGLTLNEAENVFAKTLVRAHRLSEAEVPMIYAEKRQIIRKTGLLEYYESQAALQQVGGLDQLKDWVLKRRRAFDAKAREFGLPPPRGILLVGVQGCGKSLSAKAVSKFFDWPLLRLDMGRLFSSFVGSSEFNVRRAISLAESLAPVVLWIDEIEKGFSGLQSSAQSDAGTTSRVFGSIITWLQEKTKPVFVIATANNVEALPPELIRKGRFDEIFFVDLPSPDERQKIFEIHLGQRNRKSQNFDLGRLAAATEGFSGAEIEELVVSALFNVFGEKPDIETDDIVRAAEQTAPLHVVMREQIEQTRRWAKGRAVPASKYVAPADSATATKKSPSDTRHEREIYLQQFDERLRACDPNLVRSIRQAMGPMPDEKQSVAALKTYMTRFLEELKKVMTA
ncbi:MAG: AAA family ATPase [bacterium]